MIFIALIFGFVVLCDSKPWEEGVYPQNVVTVPPNCPPGQEWLNGECREIWRYYPEIISPDFKGNNIPDQEYVFYSDNSNAVWPQNMITVPPNCPAGQQWINGACRDVWRQVEETPRNAIDVPPNCAGDQVFLNGQCRDLWARSFNLLRKLVGNLDTINMDKDKTQGVFAESDTKNVISVPNQCPIGYRPDALGVCRKIFDFRNTI